MFTRNSFFIAEFAIAQGTTDAAKDVVHTQYVSALAGDDAEIDEYVWFASDDGLRIVQFASFRTNDGAVRYLERTHAMRRSQRLAAVGEVSDLKIAGPRPQKSHQLLREPDVHFQEVCRHEQSEQLPFGRNQFYVLELACEPSKAGAVQAMVAGDFTPRVAHGDPEIEEYVWLVNDSRNRFLQFASYKSAEAVLKHYQASNGTERVARLFEICQMEHARIFGVLSEPVRALYAPPIWTHFVEFARLESLTGAS